MLYAKPSGDSWKSMCPSISESTRIICGCSTRRINGRPAGRHPHLPTQLRSAPAPARGANKLSISVAGASVHTDNVDLPRAGPKPSRAAGNGTVRAYRGRTAIPRLTMVGSSPVWWAYTYRIANFSLGGVDIGKESVNRLSTLNSLRPTVLEAYFINLMNRLDLRSYTTSASPKLGGVDLPASTVQLEIQIRWPRSPGRSVAGAKYWLAN